MVLKINNIYNECCLQTLKRFEDNSINCVITSPPYNMNLRIRNGEYCSRQIVKELTTKYNNFDDNLDIKTYNKFHTEVVKELIRVSDLVFYNIQIVTGSKRSVFKMIGHFADQLKDIIIWDKGRAEPSIHGGVLNKRTELILVFSKKNSISREFKTAQFERGSLQDLWYISKEKLQSKKHKAVFPEKLVQKIITNFTKENDIIYDPFMGLGTTAVVAKSMNRKYLGSEISKEYVDIANQRIKEQCLMPLFESKQNQQYNLFKVDSC